MNNSENNLCQKKYVPIAEAYKVLEQTQNFWKFITQHQYAQQLSLAKTYLWLSVTSIVFLGAIFNEFFNRSLNNSNIIIYSLFIASAITTFIALILGIFCLSSFWYKNLENCPYKETYVNVIRRIEQSGASSSTYLENIVNIIQHYENSTQSFMKLIDKKGGLLRVQCICLIISAFSSLFLIYCLIL